MRRYLLITAAILAVGLMAAKCEAPYRPGVCPPLKQYTQAERTQLADEIDAIIASGRYPMALKVISDFEITRKDIRACLNRTLPTK